MKKITSEEVNTFIEKHYPNRINQGESSTQMTGLPANSIVVYKDSKDNGILIRGNIAVTHNKELGVTWTREFVIPTQYKDKILYVNLIKQKDEPVKKTQTVVQTSLF
jgi:hypothetical protein